MFTFLSKRKKKEKKKKKLISSTVLKTYFLDQWMNNLIIPMKGILWPVNALQYHSQTTKKKNKGFQSIYH